MGDPHILAYTGLGVLGLIACLLAGLTWPLALWRSSSERFADFLLLVFLPLGTLAGHYLGLSQWVAPAVQDLDGQRGTYLLGAFMGTARIVGDFTWGFLVEVAVAAGAGALVVWLIRLLMWALARMRQSRSPTPSEDAPTEPLGGWGSQSASAPAAGALRAWFADRRRTGLTLGVAAVALIGGGWAWNAGYIPGNARALNKDLIAKVLRNNGGLLGSRAQVRGCVALWRDHASATADQQAFEQWPMLPWAYAPLIDEAGGAMDKRLARQLRVLKAAGYFTEEPPEVDPAGRRLQRYRLTWDGWRNQEGGCFQVGKVELDAIDGMSLRGDTALGYELWDIQARYRVKSPQEWARSPEAREAFPDIAQAIDGAPSPVVLARTRKGWFAENELTRMGRTAREVALLPIARKLPETFSESDANDLIQASRQLATLCLELPSPHGLFHQPPGMPLARPKVGDPVPAYGGTVYNAGTDRDPRRRDMAAANWKRLEMLAAAGLMDKSVSTETRDPLMPTALGSITYRLREPIQAAMTYLDPQTPSSGTCLRLGTPKVDRLSLVRTNNGASLAVKGHASIREPAAWVTEPVIKALPDVEYALRQGVYFTATITYRNSYATGVNDGDLPLAHVTLHRPKLNFAGLQVPWESNPELRILELAATGQGPAPTGSAAAPRPGPAPTSRR